VKDLPGAWNARIQDRLGVKPSNDAEGCLQDVHWAVGSFGYFPSYAIGAVIAGQLYESLRSDRPQLDEEIAAGQFGGLFEWLRTNVHSLGASLSMPEIIERATGRPLSANAWLRYVEAKYLE
jgi:carboxypeptidase Taq